MATTTQKTIHYSHPMIAVDVVIFTVINEQLQVLLIKMKKDPFLGSWAAPGGMVQPNETLDEAAKRHLKDKTGVDHVYLEQLYTFGDVGRDPFGRVVSVAYVALIPHDQLHLKTTADYSAVAWHPVKKLPALAYDHAEMVARAIKRLQNKLTSSVIAYSLLPQTFTLSALQKMYEIILDERLDKRNFRKKMLSLGLVKSVGKKQEGVANRPAELYAFTEQKNAGVV